MYVKNWRQIHWRKGHGPDSWFVKVRKGWYNADGRLLPSKKSSVWCCHCEETWRSAGKYVDELPDFNEFSYLRKHTLDELQDLIDQNKGEYSKLYLAIAKEIGTRHQYFSCSKCHHWRKEFKALERIALSMYYECKNCGHVSRNDIDHPDGCDCD